MKKIKVVLALAVVGVLIGTMAVFGMGRGTDSNLPEVTVQKQDIIKYYRFSGNIESSDVQNVVSTTNEPVKKFYVKEGDHVQKGDLLYEIDSSSIESTIAIAETTLANANTNLASAKSNYQRTQILYGSGGASLVELESARDEYSRAQNQIVEAEVRLRQDRRDYEDTKCYAEASGEVSKIYVDENDSITQGTSILDIINYDDLEVNVKVDEYDLFAVSVGLEAEAYIEALEKNVSGTISEISRGATVVYGVSYFETTLTLPADDTLRVGLSAEVRVVAESALQVLTVPVEAVLYENSSPYVQRYNDKGKLETVYVTVGISNGTDVEIKEGLNEGDRIVCNRAAKTDEASEVQKPQKIGAADGRQGIHNPYLSLEVA